MMNEVEPEPAEPKWLTQHPDVPVKARGDTAALIGAMTSMTRALARLPRMTAFVQPAVAVRISKRRDAAD
jgi:hypothetical protein